MKVNCPDHVLSVTPYLPGKPLEELEREYGIADSIKLASNENPLGPSPLALAALSRAAQSLHRYPDGSSYYLVRKLAEKTGLAPENLVLGNGSDDIIGMMGRALLVPGDEVILPQPAFAMYEIAVRLADARPVFVPLVSRAIDLEAMRAAVTEKTRLLFLTNPNNPTGTVFSADAFRRFSQSLPPGVIVVVDEAYIEFVRDTTAADMLDFLDNERPLIALRTFSKAYGLAGIRVGYGLMPPAIAEILNRARQPFNVNALAQAAALAALDDGDFLQKTLRTVHEGLDFLYTELDRLQLDYFPSQANFFLIDVKGDAQAVFTALLQEGVIVRSMVSYGFPTFIRVTAGLPRENARFIEALERVLS